MTHTEMRNTAIAAVIGAAAVFAWDWFTDRVAKGEEAVSAAQINAIIDERLKTDSNKTLHQEMTELKSVAIENSAKLDVLIDAVGALAE